MKNLTTLHPIIDQLFKIFEYHRLDGLTPPNSEYGSRTAYLIEFSIDPEKICDEDLGIFDALTELGFKADHGQTSSGMWSRIVTHNFTQKAIRVSFFDTEKLSIAVYPCLVNDGYIYSLAISTKILSKVDDHLVYPLDINDCGLFQFELTDENKFVVSNSLIDGVYKGKTLEEGNIL